MKTRLYVTVVGLVLLGGACKKDSDSVAANTCAQIEQRANAVSQAATVYSANSTKANCEAYKKTAIDYIESAGNCPTVPQADIIQARNDINAVVCP